MSFLSLLFLSGGLLLRSYASKVEHVQEAVENLALMTQVASIQYVFPCYLYDS